MTCPDCEGEGAIEFMAYNSYPYLDYYECKLCHGTGKVEEGKE